MDLEELETNLTVAAFLKDCIATSNHLLNPRRQSSRVNRMVKLPIAHDSQFFIEYIYSKEIRP